MYLKQGMIIIHNNIIFNMESFLFNNESRYTGSNHQQTSQSFTSIGIYEKKTHIQLPISSLSEKWSASHAVKRAESQLQLKDIIVTTAIGHQGLNTTRPNRLSRVSEAENFWVERDLNPGPNDSDASSL